LSGTAEYFDGRTAAGRRVRVELTPPLLRLLRDDGETLATWLLSGMRILDRIDGVLRVAPIGSDARIVVSDAAFAEALMAFLPVQRSPARTWLPLIFGVPLILLSLWAFGSRLTDAVAVLVPESWEDAAGAATKQGLTARAPACRAPAGQAALEELGRRLAQVGGVERPLRLSVIDAPEVNAWALLGGEVVLTHGLLMDAGAAAEVAGVLAHEIGHVKHRHVVRSAVRAVGVSLLVSAVTGGSDLAALGVGLVSLSHSRAFEREADAEAARMLQGAGIGTRGLFDFFERMEKRDGDPRGALSYLSTHPGSAERRGSLPVAEGVPTRPALGDGEWQALRRICAQRPG
jgi:Zn-dependent protease with chaperone function